MMSEFNIKCPYCGSEYATEERHRGVTVKCPKCLKPFQVIPSRADGSKHSATKSRFCKWNKYFVLIVALGAVFAAKNVWSIYSSTKGRASTCTNADVRHYRHFCEVLQKGDIEETIKVMRTVPVDVSASFKEYFLAMADELSCFNGLMKQFERRILQSGFAKIWDDDRILSGMHPYLSITNILADVDRTTDEFIADLKSRRKKASKSRTIFKSLSNDSDINIELYDEIIRTGYMYKTTFKDARAVYDLYRENKWCWRKEGVDIIITDRQFLTKINKAMSTLRRSAAEIVKHCQSRQRAGLNRASRALDKLESLVK